MKKTKRKYTKKSALESHAVYKDIEKVWKNSNNNFVYGYLRGMAMVNKTDDIYEELMLLSGIKRILAHS